MNTLYQRDLFQTDINASFQRYRASDLIEDDLSSQVMIDDLINDLRLAGAIPTDESLYALHNLAVTSHHDRLFRFMFSPNIIAGIDNIVNLPNEDGRFLQIPIGLSLINPRTMEMLYSSIIVPIIE